jgi:predicted DNA-binding transcriptional regulator AlpA
MKSCDVIVSGQSEEPKMAPNDELVSRQKMAKELGISVRTLYRYEAEKKAGFDQPVKLGQRTFHRRSRVEALKLLGNLLEASPLNVQA